MIFSNASRLLLVTAVLAVGRGLAFAAPANGELRLKVLVVYNLSPIAVPYTDFVVTKGFGDGAKQKIRTDEDGLADVYLEAGAYTLDSVKPVALRGTKYAWHMPFTITMGQALGLTITDSDATTSVARVVSDESMIYQRLKGGVVTVENDFGHGSGFIIDKSGLILTNQHVTNGSHWFGVRVRPGLRMEAVVIAEDKDADVAVIRINPDAYKDMVVVPLADPTSPPLAVEGEKVIAIGNPLHQETTLTTGTVSKVEKGVLISDVNINHGNSGGPLLNMQGEALGLTTFGDISLEGGPGISGVVSIDKALPVIAQAKATMNSIALPPATLLPDVNAAPIPSSIISKITAKDCRFLPDIKGPRNCQTLFDTPFMVAARQAASEDEFNRGMSKRSRRRAGKGDSSETKDPYAFWTQYAEPTDAVVEIEVRPALKETAGSTWKRALGAAVGATPTKKLEFREDFYDMKLFRNGSLVQPVRRNRVLMDAFYEDMSVKVKDRAYEGLYQYDYTVFEPTQPLLIKVRRSSDLHHWDEIRVGPELQQQLWEQFARYRELVHQ